MNRHVCLASTDHRPRRARTAAACALVALLASLAAPAHAAEGKAKKPRVAILSFPAASNAWSCSGWSNNEARMSNVLVDLFTSEISDRADGKLRLVERERLNDLRGELAFQQGAEVDPATAQKVGKLLGVQFVLTGKVTRFACKKTDAASGWGIGAIVGKVTGSKRAGDVAGSVKTKNVSFTGRLDARLVAVRTGEIVATFKDENDTGDLSVAIAGGGVDVAYDDALASKVFEPIASRLADKIVKKAVQAGRDLEEEEAEDEAAAQPRRGGAGGGGDAEDAERSGGRGGDSDDASSSSKKQHKVSQGDGGGSSTGVQGQIYSPRFDFVPGEKAVFFDDLSDTEPGDYPSKWTIGNHKGQLEVVEYQGKRWLKAIKPEAGKDMMCSGALLRVDHSKKLPAKFTVEFDVPSSGYYVVVFTDQYWFTGQDYVDIQPTSVASRNAKAIGLPPPRKPIRHVSIAVSGTTLKVYFDDERVLLDPEGVPSAAPGSRSAPSTIGVRFLSDGAPRDDFMFTNFKVAEGGKDYAKDLAMSGRIVTHGITFDSGSDVMRPESGPTLRKLLKLLQEDSGLSFEIQGHTDNQGGDKVNGPLSERRAKAVRTWLVAQGIEEARLAAKGLGATKPLQPNDTPEGRAENRRVELVKRGG